MPQVAPEAVTPQPQQRNAGNPFVQGGISASQARPFYFNGPAAGFYGSPPGQFVPSMPTPTTYASFSNNS